MKCCDNCKHVDRKWNFNDYVVCLKCDKHVRKNHLCEKYERRKVVILHDNRSITK